MQRVLSIDDDRAVHHLVKRSLETKPLEFASAMSGAEGLGAIADFRPDVVLLDLVLPDMTGLEAFAKLREHDPRLPVIFITAMGSSDTAIEAMKLGAYDYLNKPIDRRRSSRGWWIGRWRPVG